MYSFFLVIVLMISFALTGCTHQPTLVPSVELEVDTDTGSSDDLLIEPEDDLVESLPIRQVCYDNTCFDVELADTLEKRRVGLMMRRNLSGDAGMLFIFDDEAPNRKFRMKNTLIPLDMIRMDASGSVVYIEDNVPPCESDVCPSYGPTSEQAQYVLEVYSGVAESQSIVLGSTAEFIYQE